jgi:predicted ribosome quality control (RQC) complex YloA/Tae2 family protein
MRARVSDGDANRQHREPDARREAEREDRRLTLEQGLAKARARLASRIRAIRGDLDRIEGADELSRRAQLFVAEAARARRGTTKLRVVDWSSGEAVDVELPLDPARPAKEQLDAIFNRARRLKNGAPIARARLRDAETMLSRLETIAARLAGEPDIDVDELAVQARSIAPRDFVLRAPTAPGRKTKDAPPLPYRTFLGASGVHILVGRGAAHNDALTLHVARPHHLWLHAKGQAGAHVVVVLGKGTSCPPDLLVEAAHLAAHFSGARHEAVVEVTYVQKRHVRKPRGSPPGLVVVAREKVLVLRRSDEVVRRLLDRELAARA